MKMYLPCISPSLLQILSSNNQRVYDHYLIYQTYRRQGLPRGSVVKNLPAAQEMQFRSLGQEGPLEEEMAAHSSVLAWEIAWTEEPGGVQSMGSQKSWK